MLWCQIKSQRQFCVKQKRIALLLCQAKGRRLLPRKTMCPNPGGFDEEFYNNTSRVGLLIRLGCVQGLRWLVS